jgi:predicted ribosome quality control (RQC) complex YloA/Tae2 family protein
MGRYSNIILVDENGKIIDALKRVDAEMSSERLVLPGLLYRLPPPQDKLSMLECDDTEVMEKIDALRTYCAHILRHFRK